jgi:hypothetical protein
MDTRTNTGHRAGVAGFSLLYGLRSAPQFLIMETTVSESGPGRREFIIGAAVVGLGTIARPDLAPAQSSSYRLVLKDDAGREYLDDRFRYDSDANKFWIEDAEVQFGSANVASTAPDFEFSANNHKTTTRSILCHEIGDSVDIGGGRIGPDGGAAESDFATTGSKSRIVRFWGRSWVATPRQDTGEPVGWDGGVNGEDFSVCGETTIEADGEQTPTSRPGQVVLRSTRENEHHPRDALVVTKNQQLCAADDGSSAAPSWSFADRKTGHSRTALADGRVFLDVSVAGNRSADFRTPTGAQTGMALAFFDEDGSVRFEAVEIGERDSAGNGYRMLRIKN